MRTDTVNNDEQFTVAVIDDGLVGRRRYYNDLLKPFNIIYVLDRCDAEDVVKIEADFFIIDMVLWDSDYKESLEMVRKIYEKTEKPVFIVSQNFITEMNNLIYKTWEYNEYSNVLGYLDWQTIKKMKEEVRLETMKRWQTLITMGFNRYKQYNMKPLGKDQPVKILHIGDMQFGGSVSAGAGGDYMTIARQIKDENNPDLLVISGDIAQYGTKENYKEAFKWIKKLCIAIWEQFETNQDRILIIPGNHDCNLSAFAQKRFSYDLNKKNDGTTESKLSPFVDNKREGEKINYESLVGYDNFCRFAHKLTNDIRWLTHENGLNFITDRFLRWGLRFVHLFTHTKISPEDRSGFDMDTNLVESIANSIFIEGNKKSLYTILLSHGGPSDFGLNEGTADSHTTWCKVRQFLENIQPNMLLYGHKHSSRASLLEDSLAGPFLKKTVAVRTGSLRLDATGLGLDGSRSFNIITLKRKDYKVEAINVQNYNINGINIKPDKEPYENSDIHHG